MVENDGVDVDDRLGAVVSLTDVDGEANGVGDTLTDNAALPVGEGDSVAAADPRGDNDDVTDVVVVLDATPLEVTDAVDDSDGGVDCVAVTVADNVGDGDGHVTVPAGDPAQLPLQLAVVKPALLPYSPALQLVQYAAPASEYCPAGQMDCVGDVD